MSLDRYFRYIRIIQSIHFLIIFHKSQFLQMFLQNRCDLSRFCKGGFGPSDQNDIIAFFDLFFQRHKCRRDDSPCPVPLDCVSNFFGSGNAESGLTCVVFYRVGDKQWMRRIFPFAVSAAKITVLIDFCNLHPDLNRPFMKQNAF